MQLMEALKHCSRLGFFFFYCYGDHRDLHSFPTRLSSDLFPASMCAMIPMFRVSSSLNARPMLPAAFLSPGRIATASLTMAPILVSFFLTSDSGRTPCWLPPCDAHLPSS